MQLPIEFYAFVKSDGALQMLSNYDFKQIAGRMVKVHITVQDEPLQMKEEKNGTKNANNETN